MSLDQRGRDASAAARRAAARTTDVAGGLVDVRRRHRRHQVVVRSAAAAVLLAVVGAVLLALRVGAPAPPPPVDQRQRCATAVCDGSGEFVVELPAPLVWTIPRGWEQHLSGSTVAARPSGSTGRSPLVVLEDVRGGDYGSQAQDRPDAATLAAWMKTADSLGATDLGATSLAGLPAHHLTVQPTGGYLLFGTQQPIPADDRLDDAWFTQDGSFDISGFLGKDKVYVATPGQRTEVWLLDVPGGHVTAVVAPAASDAALTAAQQSILGSMSFER